jgi:hypothetical protein
MRKTILIVVAAMIVTFASAAIHPTVKAADMSAGYSHRVIAFSRHCLDLWRCSSIGCGWYRVCSRACTDGYSCHPLYGAYGPYGGVGYWGAYTDSGWSYR